MMASCLLLLCGTLLAQATTLPALPQVRVTFTDATVRYAIERLQREANLRVLISDDVLMHDRLVSAAYGTPTPLNVVAGDLAAQLSAEWSLEPDPRLAGGWLLTLTRAQPAPRTPIVVAPTRTRAVATPEFVTPPATVTPDRREPTVTPTAGRVPTAGLVPAAGFTSVPATPSPAAAPPLAEPAATAPAALAEEPVETSAPAAAWVPTVEPSDVSMVADGRTQSLADWLAEAAELVHVRLRIDPAVDARRAVRLSVDASVAEVIAHLAVEADLRVRVEASSEVAGGLATWVVEPVRVPAEAWP